MKQTLRDSRPMELIGGVVFIGSRWQKTEDISTEACRRMVPLGKSFLVCWCCNKVSCHFTLASGFWSENCQFHPYWEYYPETCAFATSCYISVHGYMSAACLVIANSTVSQADVQQATFSRSISQHSIGQRSQNEASKGSQMRRSNSATGVT